jgi:hypothetical protein
LTGQVTEQCILYSVLDGYVRHFDVVVPPDAVAHIDPELGDAALKMMNREHERRAYASCGLPELAKTGVVEAADGYASRTSVGQRQPNPEREQDKK